MLRRNSATTQASPDRFTRALRRAAPLNLEDVGINSDPIHEAVRRLNVTLDVLKSAQQSIAEMGEIAMSALAVDDIAERAILAERYDAVFQTLQTGLTADPQAFVSEGSEDLHLPMPGNAAYVIKSSPIDPCEPPFFVRLPHDGFSSPAEISTILSHIDHVVITLDRSISTFEADLRYVGRKQKGA